MIGHFPQALNLYWLTNNVISIVQARVVRMPGIRDRLGIPEKRAIDPSDLPLANPMEAIRIIREAAKAKDEAAAADAEPAAEKERTEIYEPIDMAKIEAAIKEKVAKEVEERVRMEMEEERKKRKEMEEESSSSTTRSGSESQKSKSESGRS